MSEMLELADQEFCFVVLMLFVNVFNGLKDLMEKVDNMQEQMDRKGKGKYWERNCQIILLYFVNIQMCNKKKSHYYVQL